MSKIGDRLEEEGKLEVCGSCGSLFLIELSRANKVMCGDCGTTDFTKEIEEENYEQSSGDTNGGLS